MTTKDLKSHDTALIKPGWQTTEFWTTTVADALAIASVVFHHDLTGYTPAVAVAVAGACKMAYIVKRSAHKTSALDLMATLLPVTDEIVQQVEQKLPATPRKRAASKR